VPLKPYLHLESESVKAFLIGRHWSSLTYQEIYQNYSGDGSAILTFLTPDAFKFFYPGFLLISLNEFETADMVGIAALRIFCNATPSTSELNASRIARRLLFDLEQLEAIAAVCEAVQQEVGIGRESIVDEALLNVMSEGASRRYGGTRSPQELR
jgi:hypothetical protein